MFTVDFMIIVNFLLFLISCVGLTHIVVDGKIFQPVRDFFDKYFYEYISSAIHCYQCSGFWCGMITGLIYLVQYTNYYNCIFFIIGLGWAGSFLGNFSALYMNYLQANSMLNIEDHE